MYRYSCAQIAELSTPAELCMLDHKHQDNRLVLELGLHCSKFGLVLIDQFLPSLSQIWSLT
jgi:hypothetical protein